MKREKQDKLYRRVNTCARNVHHDKKSFNRNIDSNPMKKNKKKGLDYTPLFKFLLSRVGKDWDSTYREAANRLDSIDPIFYMVSMDYESSSTNFRYGESTYFSRLYVKDGILMKVDSSVNHTSFKPECKCCTHTFNGNLFTKKYSK